MTAFTSLKKVAQVVPVVLLSLHLMTRVLVVAKALPLSFVHSNEFDVPAGYASNHFAVT